MSDQPPAKKSGHPQPSPTSETKEFPDFEWATDLGKAVEILRSERLRFHELLDALPVYVILLSTDHQVPFANRFFEDRFGKSEGRRCYEYLFQRAEPCEKCETFKVLQTRALHRWEWTGPDNHIYDIYDYPFTDVDGSPLIMEVGLDVTEQKKNERALVERTSEVDQLANQLRGLAVQLSQAELRERKRLSKVLHDHIQQLLVAARMQVGWIKSTEDLERIRVEAQGVDAILKEALEQSRSLAIELSPPVLHEIGLIGGLNWLASLMLEKNHFKVSLRLDRRAEPVSEEIRVLLFECARELLLNAVKHAGVSEAKMTLLLTKEGHLKLIVRDEGKGFDPDILKKRRAGEASLGLFSIQQRMAHIGGQMEIATAPGKGTSISVTIPNAKVKAIAGRADSSAWEGGAESVKTYETRTAHRVLVVDDHKIMREGLVGLMQFEQDIEVVGQAADGPQAIELADKLHPDVIVMDVNLGGMSGVEASKIILATNPDIKIIGLSMHLDRHVAKGMRDAGAVAYLTKGAPSEELLATIRACVKLPKRQKPHS
jgi:signal transduction histidine kinase/ActR/RegA family two-component response regulator